MFMSIERHGVILSALERFCGTLRDFFGKSRVLSALSMQYSRIESAFRESSVRAACTRERDRFAWQYRFRQAWMRRVEKSLLMRGVSRLAGFLLTTSVSTYGLFGVLYGVFLAAIELSVLGMGSGLSNGILAALMVAMSAPLLHSHRSLSWAIRSSRLLGAFLLDFCRLSESRFGNRERGIERPYLALLAAFLIGALSIRVNALFFWTSLLLALLLWLLLTLPELTVTALLLFLPLMNLLPHPTYLLLSGVLLCEVAWLWKALCGRRQMRFACVDFLLLLWGCVLLCGGLVSAGGMASFRAAITSVALLSIWFPIRGMLSDAVWRGRALSAIRLSSLPVSVLGILQYALGRAELRWIDPARFSDIGGRVCSVFSNPNMLAVYLLLVTPLWLIAIFDSDKRFSSRFLAFFGFFCAALCLILTWSRGAWLGLLLSLLLFLLSHSRTSCACLFLLSIPCLSALPFLPDNVINRFSSIGMLGESSIRYRLYTWVGVVRMLRNYPWGIGVGEAAFKEIYPVYAVSGTEGVMHSHQLFLQIAVEMGIVGVAVFGAWLGLLVLYWIGCLKRQRGRARGETVGLGCSLVGVLVMSFFDYVWYHYGMLFLFFACCAILSVTRENDWEESE